MTVTVHRGDILKSDAAFIVIPVNTVGVMGAGLARQFAERFPNSVPDYHVWCRTAQRKGGDVGFGARIDDGRFDFTPVWFASKEHWQARSEAQWIERGLDSLRGFMALYGEGAVCALPLVGAGLGGLHAKSVEAAIIGALGSSEQLFELWIS